MGQKIPVRLIISTIVYFIVLCLFFVVSVVLDEIFPSLSSTSYFSSLLFLFLFGFPTVIIVWSGLNVSHWLKKDKDSPNASFFVANLTWGIGALGFSFTLGISLFKHNENLSLLIVFVGLLSSVLWIIGSFVKFMLRLKESRTSKHKQHLESQVSTEKEQKGTIDIESSIMDDPPTFEESLIIEDVSIEETSEPAVEPDISEETLIDVVEVATMPVPKRRSFYTMEELTNKLNQSRQELLDLTFRNTLINYRLLKSRGIAIVDELPQEIYRLMVVKNKKMSFLPKPEAEDAEKSTVSQDQANEQSVETDVILPPLPDVVEDEIQEHHLDTKLQTSHIEKDLQKRLLNTYYTARTYVQEQGVNILYLALGMLEWYESSSSEIKRKSPLILIPVTLTRSSVKAPFRLEYTGDDLGGNLSLQAKLHADFGLELPTLPEPDDIDLPSYFSSVEHVITTQLRWHVNKDAIALGFFTFGSFLMYNDLDTSQWPEHNLPVNHNIMKALLGDGFQNGSTDDVSLQLEEDAFIDDYVRPQESHQVVDADSSQILAILDVNHGHNLVIQGPPGTGKSQTITNIIAEAIGAGKKVLFVAEKMAALEVVKRRLDSVGLGEACLELHSHKTNKKAVLAELKRTHALSKPITVDGTHDYQTLLDKQKHLNAYSFAVNTPVLYSELTPYTIYGQLIQLREKLQHTNAPELDIKGCQTWSRSDFQQRIEVVGKLQTLLQDAGTLAKHPFWGSQYMTFLPINRRQVEDSAQKAEASTIALHRIAGQVNEWIGSPLPTTVIDSELSCQLVQHMIDAPNLDGIQYADEAWQRHAPQIQEAVEAGSRVSAHHSQFDEVLIPEAWTQDVLPLRKAYVAYGEKWWRIFSGDFRKAKRELTGLCQADLPKDVSVQMKMIEAIMEVQRLLPVLQEQEPMFAQVFGSHWQSTDSDWDYLTAVTNWLSPTYKNVVDGRVPAGLIEYTATHANKENLQSVAIDIDKNRQTYEQCLTDVLASTKIDETQRWGGQNQLQSLPISKQIALFKQWQQEPGKIQDMVKYNHIVQQLEILGISEIISVAISWLGAGQHLCDLLTRTYYDSLIEAAFKERPLLSTFNSAVHEQQINNFCELDKYQFELNRQQLATAHWQTLPKHGGGGQLGVLLREFEKRSRHKPIRQLMTEAGNVIQALKPVFMMGPMSVAMYLPPDALQFDLVVFDEASQVRPVDAFGAILRSEQAVVVGDSKQLPPTSFFDKMVEGEESVTGDLESVLGLFAAQGAPQQMLRWHYRSRHESLIAVSNYEFYDNKLVIFPSPSIDNTERGVVYHHLKDTHYDRGKSRTNMKEAETVARAVMAHARNTPELTLGVAAFSTAQMQAVQDWVERLRRLDPSCERFFRQHPDEPFFVKNLENVQGDERDVIFISIGYGRDANGYLTMNFGPLNNDGGERRLNVLITRARQRCELFTNLEADDIDLHKTNARGVAALKQYLTYAKTRKLNIPKPTEREADSPFEESVAASIRELGYDVVHQVGSAGFFIDLAIKDPNQPGRYLLGVECDGATYHSARSARDRDRLRQTVLEGLGWRIHRIWSTDWFQNPTHQIERLVTTLEDAKINQSAQSHPQKKKTTPIQREKTAPVTEKKGRMNFAVSPTTVTLEKHEETAPTQVPYEVAKLSITTRLPLSEISQKRLSEYIVHVVRTESPIHQDEVKRRILNASRETRLGSRAKKSLQDAIKKAVWQGKIKHKGDFLWLRKMEGVSLVRDRSNLPKASQKVELVAPEEIRLAIKTAVNQAYGLRDEDVPRATLELLGLNRVTANRKKAVQQTKATMLEEGILYFQGEHLLCK